jgi:hypothetical protein
MKTKGKRIFLLSLVFIATHTLCAQANDSEKEIEKTISGIDQFINKKDVNGLNHNYIHPDFGLYDMYRNGVIDRYSHLKKIPNKTEEWSVWTSLFMSPMKYKNLKKKYVSYDCDKAFLFFVAQRKITFEHCRF